MGNLMGNIFAFVKKKVQIKQTVNKRYPKMQNIGVLIK